MKKKITPEMKNALKEGLIVFAWAGASAVLPLLLAYLQDDPKWAVLIPVINAVFFSIKTELKNRGYLK